jgi:hypothetical protein
MKLILSFLPTRDFHCSAGTIPSNDDYCAKYRRLYPEASWSTSCGLSAPVSLLLPTVGIFSYDLMLPKDGLPADGAKDAAAIKPIEI